MCLVILGISAVIVALTAAAFSMLEYCSIKQLVNERESYWKKVREEK